VPQNFSTSIPQVCYIQQSIRSYSSCSLSSFSLFPTALYPALFRLVLAKWEWLRKTKDGELLQIFYLKIRLHYSREISWLG